MKGSIQNRGNGKYFLTVSCGFDAKGNRIRKTKTVEAKNEIDAKAQLALFVQDIERGTHIDSAKMSFGEYLEMWLKQYVEKNLADKTIAFYKSLIQGRIIPALGHIKLQKLQPIHLIQFYNNLQEKGIRRDTKSDILSSSTISKYHKAISSALQDAVEWQLIFNNPCERVKPPKVIKKESKYLDEKQSIILLSALENEPLKYKTMIYLDITTGLRRGELMAIEWQDIDFNKNSIKIKKSLQYISKAGQSIKEPKNKSSVRTVVFPEFVAELLKKYRIEQKENKLKAGDKWISSDYAFTQDEGRLMHVDTISKWFHSFIKRYNHKILNFRIPETEKEILLLPEITFHGLRHSAATMLMSKGLNLRAISGVLGHAQSSTTLNIYSHMVNGSSEEAATIMTNIFDKTFKENKNSM